MIDQQFDEWMRIVAKHYWQSPTGMKGDSYRFGWTNARAPDGYFYAFTHRKLKGGSLRLVKKVAFGRRKEAREQAYQWFMDRRRVVEPEVLRAEEREAKKRRLAMGREWQKRWLAEERERHLKDFMRST